MDVLNIVMQLFHVAGAVALVGGLLFGSLVLLPAMRLTDESYRRGVLELIGRRFITVLHGAMALLLISGAYNWYINVGTYRVLKDVSMSRFMTVQSLLGLKVLLALVMFAWVIKRGSNVVAETPERWLKINLLLSALIIVMAAVVREMRLGALASLVAG